MPHRWLHVTEYGVQPLLVVLVDQLSDELFGLQIVVAVVFARCLAHSASAVPPVSALVDGNQFNSYEIG